jgi:hypothetical protein
MSFSDGGVILCSISYAAIVSTCDRSEALSHGLLHQARESLFVVAHPTIPCPLFPARSQYAQVSSSKLLYSSIN